MAEKPMAEYWYAKRIKIQLIVINTLLFLIVPVIILQGKYYWLAAVVALLSLAFAFIIWQDSSHYLAVYSNRLVQKKGRGPFYKEKEIKWHNAAFLKDNTGLFSFGRSFYIRDNSEPKPVRIQFDSSVDKYQDLLSRVIKLSPDMKIDKRAMQMASKIGVYIKQR